MEEKDYFLIRKAAFWLFTALFFILTPVLLLYSLGYKFNIESKRFIKTGTISIKTDPENARVFLDNIKLEKTTPYILAGLFPGAHTVTLEKEDFYLYKTLVEVRPSFVTELNIVLLPQIRDMEKMDFASNIYKFFIVDHIFGGKIFIFTDQGIFLADKDFKNTQRLSTHSLGYNDAIDLKGIIEVDDKLVFWNPDYIWAVDISGLQENEDIPLLILYKAKRSIKEVFLGIKDKYIVLQDGPEVSALDIDNKVIFPILRLKNSGSEIFYDSVQERFYLKEKVPQTGSFSIFRLDLFPSIFEKLKNEKAS